MALEPTERRSCWEITRPASLPPPLLRSLFGSEIYKETFVCLRDTELRNRCEAERRVPGSKHSKHGSVAKVKLFNDLMMVK